MIFHKIRFIRHFSLLALCTIAVFATAQSDSTIVEKTEAEIAVEEAAAAVKEAIQISDAEKAGSSVTLDAVEEAKNTVDSALEVMESASARSLSSSITREKPRIDDDDTIRLYSDGYEGLEMLDSVVVDFSVFITGENHTYTESNARLWFKMIKYLNEKAGVRNVMFEYGQTYGFLVNEYLKTGDTVLFNSIDRFAYPEYSKVIKELKVYNDSLPEDRKLYFTAIDIDRGVYPIVKALEYLLKGDSKSPSDSIALHIQSIKSLANYNDFKLDEEESYSFTGFNFKTGKTLDLVFENFKNNRADYKTYLGDKYEAFRKIIEDQYIARKTWYGYQKDGAIQEYIFRENYMHQTFLSERAKHPGNWFGQFGRCHTTKSQKENNSCEWFEFHSLANRIKNTAGGELQNEVLTLTQVYDTDRNFGAMHENDVDGFRPYFEDMPKNGMVLFDITSDSTLNAGYGDDFDYLIFNTNNQRGSSYDYLNIGGDDDEENDTKVSFQVGVGEQSIDIDDFAQQFINQGHTDLISSPFQFYEFAIAASENGWVNTTVFSLLRPQSVFAGTTEWTIDGYAIKSHTGYDVFKGTEWLDLVPTWGFGYQQLSALAVEFPDSTGTLANGFIGEEKHTLHTNPAFIFDFNGVFGLHLGKFHLGARAGYILDVSKKRWRTGEQLLRTGAETSLSGFYQSVFIGVQF